MILLIEDNCESLGATFNNKAAGSFVVLGMFSWFFSHHISTMEGELIITDDEELSHIILLLRSDDWTHHLSAENEMCGALAKE